MQPPEPPPEVPPEVAVLAAALVVSLDAHFPGLVEQMRAMHPPEEAKVVPLRRRRPFRLLDAARSHGASWIERAHGILLAKALHRDRD